MLLRVHDLPAEGIQMAEHLDPRKLQELAALQENQACKFEGPLAVSLRVRPSSGLLSVRGRFQAMVIASCSRCLVPVEVPLESAFRLTFAPAVPGDGEHDAGEARELKAEEMGLVLFEGDTIDLRDAIQEQVIMTLPMQVHCREDCRGLCAGCGLNLNTEPCQCAGDAVDPRLAILKQLKLNT
jgi:uncharacterized protein